MGKSKYSSLKEHYPEHISLDQLSRICKIAKRSAKYLVEHGIIPAADTGRKTWRYKIALEDVISYLYRREQVGSMIPCGAINSRGVGNTGKLSNRRCFAQVVEPGEEQDIAEFFKYIYSEYDEVLTTGVVTEITGIDKSYLLKRLKAGDIRYFAKDPYYLILKEHLLEFVVHPRFVGYKTESEHFIRILGGFELWKNAKSSQ